MNIRLISDCWRGKVHRQVQNNRTHPLLMPSGVQPVDHARCEKFSLSREHTEKHRPPAFQQIARWHRGRIAGLTRTLLSKTH